MTEKWLGPLQGKSLTDNGALTRDNVKAEALDIQQLRLLMNNTLQSLMSEINTNSTLKACPGGADLIEKLETRLSNTALISESLYGLTTSVGTIEQRLLQLANAQIALNSDSSQRFTVFVSVEGEVPAELQMPIVKTVNELLWNALKYGLGHQEAGRIEIRSKIRDDQEIVITVADNGIGFADAPRRGDGLAIAQSLTRAFNGSARLCRMAEITVAEIIFPLHPEH